MEVFVENLAAYFLVGIFIAIVLFYYLKSKKRQSVSTEAKIQKAIEYGFHEPVSLHPVIDYDICIGSGACVAACPEKDILGLVNGKAKTINASHCVGHGACFHACPVQAISLVMGTEKRGVELPHVSQYYETNVPGVFIAGELGGMGLIKNAVEQGKLAMENITGKLKNFSKSKLDVIIVGAGPSGISASLTAKKNNLNFITLEQDTLGGTVFAFPRAKVVMTSPMELPLHGRVKLTETSKIELLKLWHDVLNKNNIKINESEKVLEINKHEGMFEVVTSKQTYETSTVLLTIGRRGSPRKLGVPGEEKEKVTYRLLEPELIHDKNILVVGGGDSAIESALLLAEEKNNVTLSYRGESFSRLKPKNLDKINNAGKNKTIKVILNSNVKEILDDSIIIESKEEGTASLENDLVYIFAGGELPNKFLEKIGIRITKKFGETILKH
ncbi:MAG: NAD(P)-binding domain-containing protein [Ignavibacteriae bacterium]|nr:4Fe-4S dicluster domain-containing protein [Ignavibacteriota bacterium]NOG98696.1 NAD(P)-binding domain-containing protein [Ignavibacteriota bacterium]